MEFGSSTHAHSHFSSRTFPWSTAAPPHANAQPIPARGYEHRQKRGRLVGGRRPHTLRLARRFMALHCFLLLALALLLADGNTAWGTPRTNDLSSTELGRREQRQRLQLIDGKFSSAKSNPSNKRTPAETTADSSSSSPTNAQQQQQNNIVDGQSGNGNDGRQPTAAGKYKVIRVEPESDTHLKLLERLEVNGADLELNFWTSPVRIKSGVDIMIPADKVSLLRRYLHKHRMHTEVIIDDVEQLIIQREQKNAAGSTTSSNGSSSRTGPERFRRQKDEVPPQAGSANDQLIDFYHYNSYAQMVAWMRALAKRYPKFVQFISVGKSHEGRAIDGLEIGSRGFRKRAFWIDGGIHAREWAAPHTALYFIHQLTSRYGHDEDITRLVNEITWVVVPLLNPDGYEYTRSSTNPNIRLWRKNRSPTHCVRDQWGRQRCCKGVDLNRNFDFHFKESGSSDDPCSEIYQGKQAFSEPEAKAVRDAILSNRYRGRIDGFITLHTYSQIWIHPYGHKRDSYPGDVQDLYAVGKKATTALSRLYGTKYVIGSGADTLYPASGGSEDWAKESANIKFVYLLELRPDEKNWDGFILDEGQLIPTASETWAGVKVVADAIIQRARARRVASSSAATAMHRLAGIPQFRPVENGGGGTSTENEQQQQQQSTPAAAKRPPPPPLPAASLPTALDGGVDEWAKGGEQQQQQRKSCVDRRRACKRWVLESAQICHAVPVFMGEQCARSCGFC